MPDKIIINNLTKYLYIGKQFSYITHIETNNRERKEMKTIKFTEAKTATLKAAIHLLDMYKNKVALKEIKAQALVSGFDVKGRTSKAICSQLVSIYEQALQVEEAETLVVA